MRPRKGGASFFFRFPTLLGETSGVRRLGKNHGAYHGETIEIVSVVKDCLETGRQHGWEAEEILAVPELKLHALCRRARVANPQAAVRVYISAGIHGDEPAGPLAVQRLLREDAWPDHAEIWLCPCLNPTGFPLNRRENAQGRDLNRDYLHSKSAEVRAHIAWLDRQPAFDLSLCLHEDWEAHGFYLYELNPDNRASLAEKMVEQVSTVCPIDPSEIIEDRPARNGIIRPSLDPKSRPDWPEAFYLIQHKTRLCYTLESPSDFPLAMRVEALMRATRAAVEGR